MTWLACRRIGEVHLRNCWLRRSDPKMSNKVKWLGTLLAIQPRIRLMRSFDQRSHSYLGYALRIQERIADEEREFSVGIGQV